MSLESLTYPLLRSFAAQPLPPESNLTRILARALAARAYRTVPRYRAICRDAGFSSARDLLYCNWDDIPITSRKTLYPGEQCPVDACRHGRLPRTGSIDESAGSSTGKPNDWVRCGLEDRILLHQLNFAWRYTYGGIHRKIIVINAFSAGPWATGLKFAAVISNFDIVKTVGTDFSAAINVLERYGKNHTYVIAGYPADLSSIARQGTQRGVDWRKLDIHLLTGGDGLSEPAAGRLAREFSVARTRIRSAYGASDLDIGIAFDTDVAVAAKSRIHKLISDGHRSEIAHLVDSSRGDVVFLGQFNPAAYLIENRPDDVMLFTQLNPATWMPAIRYKLNDVGRVHTFPAVVNSLKLPVRKGDLRLPFIILQGRTDSFSVGGANIYESHMIRAIDSVVAKVPGLLGDFIVFVSDSGMWQLELLCSESELAKLSQRKDELAQAAAQELTIVNSDYKDSLERNPEASLPSVRLEADEKQFSSHRTTAKFSRIRKLKDQD